LTEEEAIALAIEEGGTRDEMANNAYWDSHPECPQKLDAKDPSHASCIKIWKRIRKKLDDYLDGKKPPPKSPPKPPPEPPPKPAPEPSPPTKKCDSYNATTWPRGTICIRGKIITAAQLPKNMFIEWDAVGSWRNVEDIASTQIGSIGDKSGASTLRVDVASANQGAGKKNSVDAWARVVESCRSLAVMYPNVMFHVRAGVSAWRLVGVEEVLPAIVVHPMGIVADFTVLPMSTSRSKITEELARAIEEFL
jgi:hypothetical protein